VREAIVRLLVCGSRTLGEGDGSWLARHLVDATLTGLWSLATMGYLVTDLEGFTLIEGGCPTGGDALARWWACKSPLHSYDAFPADRADPHAYPDHPPFELLTYPADWEGPCDPEFCGSRNHRRPGRAAGSDYCPVAGFRRNQRMLDEGQPDHGLAFVDRPLADSRGTADMVTRLARARVPYAVMEVPR